MQWPRFRCYTKATALFIVCGTDLQNMSRVWWVLSFDVIMIKDNFIFISIDGQQSANNLSWAQGKTDKAVSKQGIKIHNRELSLVLVKWPLCRRYNLITLPFILLWLAGANSFIPKLYERGLASVVIIAIKIFRCQNKTRETH